MTHGSSQQVDRDNLAILASLAAASGEFVSPDSCPPPATIAAFHDGRLSAEQAAATKQHLRVCHRCYQDWVALIDVADIVDARAAATAPRWRRWLSGVAMPAPMRAATAALVLLGAIGTTLWVVSPERGDASLVQRVDGAFGTFVSMTSLPARERLIDSGRWVWRPGLASRGLQQPIDGDVAAFQALRAFAAGAGTGLRALAPSTPDWQIVLADLPASPGCADTLAASECDNVNDVFQSLGRWAVVLHFACGARADQVAGGSETIGFWTAQTELLGDFEHNARRVLPDRPLTRYLGMWREGVANGVDTPGAVTALCDRSAGFLSLGLTP